MQVTKPSKKILQNQIQSAFTTAPVVVPDHIALSSAMEFLRLTKSGTLDPIFSLSRSKWNQLILPCKENKFRPPIKSISLRKPGTQRGVRLIVIASAREYFARLIAEAQVAVEKPEEVVPKVRGRKFQPKSSRK